MPRSRGRTMVPEVSPVKGGTGGGEVVKYSSITESTDQVMGSRPSGFTVPDPPPDFSEPVNEISVRRVSSPGRFS